MNWQERFLPTNKAEAGLLKIIGVMALLFFVDLVGIQVNYGLLILGYGFLFYVVKFGNEALANYEIKSWVAYATAAMVIFPFIWLWVICALISAWIANLLVDKSVDWLAFGLFAILVYLTSSPLKHSLDIVYARWFGKYRKEAFLNDD
ncbi:MAG: hypothetical protein IPM53_32555 [Anaerolineaceae bacterium]|nr:hypothetical protein [Anaerolineaceae bacterium]